MNGDLVEQAVPQSPRFEMQRGATPSDLLQIAIQSGAAMDTLERLYGMQQRYDADEARKAYVAAMAEFKAEPHKIVKDKLVSFSGTSYTHASIGNVVAVVCAALGRHGFSHRWDTHQDGGVITVTCIITHKQGHSESTTLSGEPDNSGKKNAIQQTASTITYLQRYTLLAATGLATSDQDDDDGRSFNQEPQPRGPHYDDPEFADWKTAITSHTTQEEFAATWKQMSPETRAVMAPLVKARKEELFPNG